MAVKATVSYTMLKNASGGLNSVGIKHCLIWKHDETHDNPFTGTMCEASAVGNALFLTGYISISQVRLGSVVCGAALHVNSLTHCSPALLFGLERLFVGDRVGPGFEHCCILLLFLLFFHLKKKT